MRSRFLLNTRVFVDALRTVLQFTLQVEGRKSIEYLSSQLSTMDQTLLPLVLQEIRGLGQAHHCLLPLVMGEVEKQAASGSSAVRLLVQQIKEDNKK